MKVRIRRVINGIYISSRMPGKNLLKVGKVRLLNSLYNADQFLGKPRFKAKENEMTVILIVVLKLYRCILNTPLFCANFVQIKKQL